MLDKLFGFLARVAIGKHLVAGLAFVHNKLNGNKSEMVLALLAVVHGLKLAGIIPSEAAQSVETVLGGILPLALADRANKIKRIVDGAVNLPNA